ncbi:MAG: hypothetical protein ACRCUT_13325 [Spirochaetota bacterium]
MKRLDRYAFILYLCNSVLSFAFALKYLITGSFMSYHEAAAGMKWEDVAPGLQMVLQSLFKVTAAAFLISGAVTVVLLLIPYRRGELWSKMMIAFVNGVFSAALLYATLHVYLNTPGFSPWPAAVFSLTTTAAAFAMNCVSEKMKR